MEYKSVVEHLLSMPESLNSLPTIRKKEEKKGGRKEGKSKAWSIVMHTGNPNTMAAKAGLLV